MNFSEPDSATIASYFDIGAIAGNIILGTLSDLLGLRAPFFTSSLLLAGLITLKFSFETSISLLQGSFYTFLIGFFAMGAAIVMNAIMGDIGKKLSSEGKANVITTITGFNDGAGSFGSAFG